MNYSDFDKIITANRIAEYEKKVVIDMLEDVIYNKKYGRHVIRYIKESARTYKMIPS